MVLIPFGARLLALDDDTFQNALAAGDSYLPTPSPALSAPSEVLDAEGMSQRTGVPASWFLEQARQGKLPHIRAGKYVRFRLDEVLAALATGNRPGDRLSFNAKKKANVQEVGNTRYQPATALKR